MPDLIDEIRQIAAKIEKSKAIVQTEEATKNAFVMPFISALGYDVFDPTEVTPEFIADVGVKKGEKIDYAIMKDGKPIVLFECKHHSVNLDLDHASQLFRYYACTDTRVAILTNGVEYRLFTDLDERNKMDSKPFLIFKITDFPESLVPELKKLSKSAFDIEAVLSSAAELKYMREIKHLIAQQLLNPSEEFVSFCVKGIGAGRMTQSVKDQFTQLTRKALNGFVTDQLGEKLKAALGNSAPNVSYETKVTSDFVEAESKQDSDPTIETTIEELEAFYIVKAILHGVVDLKRIVHRDQKSYFTILLDDNNRKPIIRLWFNRQKQKYVSLFDEERNEEKIAISGPDEIYAFTDKIRARVVNYDSEK
jgi:hypothetical protein